MLTRPRNPILAALLALVFLFGFDGQLLMGSEPLDVGGWRASVADQNNEGVLP